MPTVHTYLHTYIPTILSGKHPLDDFSMFAYLQQLGTRPKRWQREGRESSWLKLGIWVLVGARSLTGQVDLSSEKQRYLWVWWWIEVAKVVVMVHQVNPGVSLFLHAIDWWVRKTYCKIPPSAMYSGQSITVIQLDSRGLWVAPMKGFRIGGERRWIKNIRFGMTVSEHDLQILPFSFQQKSMSRKLF